MQVQVRGRVRLPSRLPTGVRGLACSIHTSTSSTLLPTLYTGLPNLTCSHPHAPPRLCVPSASPRLLRPSPSGLPCGPWCAPRLPPTARTVTAGYALSLLFPTNCYLHPYPRPIPLISLLLMFPFCVPSCGESCHRQALPPRVPPQPVPRAAGGGPPSRGPEGQWRGGRRCGGCGGCVGHPRAPPTARRPAAMYVTHTQAQSTWGREERRFWKNSCALALPHSFTPGPC